MIKPLEDAKVNMSKAIEKLKNELSQIRTARASTKLLEGIMVTAYGSKLALNKVAVISQVEPRILEVKPFDINIIVDIEKAIVASNLGVSVQNNKDSIRVTFPPLTEERRKELVKVVKKIVEDFKVSIRNHRRYALEAIKK
ncbi:MAG: ribosome recycling factor, partial [bacterium]|nr:ribosome recycling factor [bacterium]